MRTRMSLSTLGMILVGCVGLWFCVPAIAEAHCDGLDGPVVTAARKALAAEHVNLVLIWVQKKDEAEINQAFQKAITARKAKPETQDVTNRRFFETLVRVHRAGEGAPYTGLKPAGRDLGPAIPAADKAIETGSAETLVKLLTEEVQQGVATHFNEVMAKKAFKPDDVEAGRAYIKAYVEYVHYVERLHETTRHPAEGHYHEDAATATHHDEE